MKRLRGSDAFTIYSETPTSPFVTLKVAIYKPVDASDIPTFTDIKNFVNANIARQGVRASLRIMRVPFDLHHPVWVADSDFSPENHIFQAELPPPGTKAQLCDFISDLLGKPLDPERPLWEVWSIGGLEGGKIALAARLHHALADGNALAAMIADSHSKTPGAAPEHGGAAGEALPGKARLIGDAIVDLVKSYTVDLPKYYQYLKQARERSRVMAGGEEVSASMSPAPLTIFNSPGGSERIYRYETVSLVAIKSLSKQFGCTVNAMVMGICSEALKRYLQEVDRVPGEPLISAMPVGALGEEDFKTLLHSDIHNNSVAVAMVPLDLNIADFGERLQAIVLATAAAIRSVQQRGGRRFDNYLDYLPGTAIRLINETLLKRLQKERKPYANLIVSNVKGPQKPLYALDGRLEMVELLSTGNLMDGGCLNITVWSYVDKLSFSCYSRKGALPEPEKINSYIREVVEELQAKARKGS